MSKLQRGSWRKDRKKGNRNIVPTVMLGLKSEQVYVQGGQYFAPNGQELETPPEWAVECVANMNKETLSKLGFEIKFGKLKAKPKAKAEPEPDPVPEPEEEVEE